MSLEDVDYMIENSVKDSIVIFADSASRNTDVFPNPENYVIEFDQPIRNVYGIEVLDVTVPATVWNINYTNNAFAFSRVFPSNGFNRDNFLNLFDAVQHDRAFSRLWEGKFNSDIYICTNSRNYDALKQSVPNVDASYNIILCKYVIFQSTNNNLQSSTHSIKKTNNSDTSNTNVHTFSYDANTYDILTSDPYYSVILNKSYVIALDMSLIYFDHFYVSDLSLKNVVTSEPLYDMHISNTYFYIEEGDYDSLSLQQYLIKSMQLLAAEKPPLIPVQNTKSGNIGKQAIMSWRCDEIESPFIFDIEKSSCGGVLGFSRNAKDNEEHLYKKLNHKTNKKLFMSQPVTVSGLNNELVQDNTLTPPGLINLLGLRYMLLRIPEIEQHMNSSFSYNKHFPGIALIKLNSGNNSVMQLRFDFVNLVRKPFHPIGKLSKLHMKFETNNGELYDFKGIDHTIVFMFKIYTPKASARPAISLLNPNYNPNVLDFIVERDAHNEGDNDGDDQMMTKRQMTNDDDFINTRRMIQEQSRFAYSSDEEDDDED
jgi:hypothetical protein